MRTRPADGPLARPVRDVGLRVAALLSLAAAAGLGGCASRGPSAATEGRSGATEGATRVASEAARQPLRDVGLMRREVPPALARIADPYAAPTGPGCSWLTYEIAQIDAVLPPDPGAPNAVDDRTAMERGREVAGDVAADAVRGAAVAWIPARGVLRRLTGAEKADRLFREAETRGRLRRAYLRGLAAAQSCPVAPAASPTASAPATPAGDAGRAAPVRPGG